LGWVLAQVAEFAFETFGAPDWVLKSLVIALVLGLPLVVFLAWAFELTPEGIKRDAEVDHRQPAIAQKGHKLDRAIIVLLLVALAWFAWDRISPEMDDDSAATAAAETRAALEQGDAGLPADMHKPVAVLPFIAMSSGPDDEYFADGLTEEILNSLAALPELLVTARTSAFSFKGKDVPVQEIAAVLQVEHIVEGSVRRSGERLRVTAQLIRAKDGFHLWSETYDRDTGDTFRIQSDIAEKIALALDIVLDDDSRAQMALAKIRNPAAFVAFQKARELFALAHGQLPQLPTLEKANAYFDRAIELEPNFYHAYVARNDYYTHTLTNYARERQQTADLEQADLDAIRRALETNYEAAIRLTRTIKDIGESLPPGQENSTRSSRLKEPWTNPARGRISICMSGP
jgi:TolB-like protein